MWQQLVNEVGMVWIVMVLVLTAVVIGVTAVLGWLLRGVSLGLSRRLRGLRQDIETLPACRIENLKQTQVIVGDRGGPEMKLAFEQMADDSKAQFGGLWVPQPSERLTWQMLLNRRAAWLMQASVSTLPFLVGLLVTFVAFVLALAISDNAFANDWMRFLALLPLLLGGLAWLALRQIRQWGQEKILDHWRAFLVQVERKLPVYNQAAETASLLNAFVHYDQQMTKAAKQLSDRVDALASGELTESITGAVKYVMSASVAPPIQKSADALSLLAQQLDKKLMTGENALMRLYNELESRQQQQAELWMKRYQETSQSLSQQQKQSLQQLVLESQTSWQDLNAKLSNLLQSLSQGQESLQTALNDGQVRLQQDLLQDQQQSLAAIRQESIETIGLMKEQYTATVETQASRQQEALDEIRREVLASVGQVSTAMSELTAGLAAAHAETLQRLTDHQAAQMQALSEQQQAGLLAIDAHQSEKLSAIVTGQEHALSQFGQHQAAALASISQNQETVLESISQHQGSVLESISQNQASLLESIRQNQASVLETISLRQADALDTISVRQQETLQVIGDHQDEALGTFIGQQVTALEAMNASQQAVLARIAAQIETGLHQIDQAQQQALTGFGATQTEAIAALALQQSQGVHDLLEQFSGQVADILADHLGPVSSRLDDSAQALISAQVYARDVQQTLAIQKEQTQVLEESIREVLSQFVSTRKAMTDDLGSLEKSTRIMSESAASMSAIYAGSQTGLSDAIGQMSHDMISLSDALQEVLRGSAEQTKLLQAQANETYEINQQHLDAVRSQIDILTNDLSNRIDQLMLGFSQLTEDLIRNVQSTVDNQNDQLGSGLKALTGIMADEARSISLYAQQINMDINQLNSTLGEAVSGFSEGIQFELNRVLKLFDQETADILRRLSVAASELGDAVEVLPEVIRNRTSGRPGSQGT